ncbi:MAG: hypothetical protein QW815_01975 [Nitrososphaerota archaeon]
MIKERMRSDLILEFLIKKAFITEVQLDTYLSYKYGERKGLSLDERIGLRDGRRVSKGAFLRTLKQARGRIQRALWTLLLVNYLGLLTKDGLSALVNIGELLLKLEGKVLSDDAVAKIIDALTRTVDGMVNE